MTKLRDKYEFQLLDTDCEHDKDPVSVTVPDETMSIREIMTRFVRGMPLGGNVMRDGKYEEHSDFDSPDLEKVRDMDFVERDELLAKERAKTRPYFEPRKKPIKAKSEGVDEGEPKKVPPKVTTDKVSTKLSKKKKES